MRDIPDDLDPEDSYIRIIDLYITHTRLRLRKMETPAGKTVALKLGQKYFSPDQETLHRTMTTIYLNAVEFQTLASLDGSTLIKRRYPYAHVGYNTSIDVFESHLRGLIMLEIQCRSDIDFNDFPVPVFALREVTEEPFFTGGELARLTKEEFQKQFKTW